MCDARSALTFLSPPGCCVGDVHFRVATARSHVAVGVAMHRANTSTPSPVRFHLCPKESPVNEQEVRVDPGVRAALPFDAERAEAAVRELLHAMGEDPDREGLRSTPARVARAYAELTSGMRQRPEDVLTTFFEERHDEMVLVRDIEFWSMCEHHLVPFTGVAHVGYIPAERGVITGLSKLARLVDVYAKRPQLQERLTTQVADALMDILEARGVIVVLEAEHLCMTMRGVKKAGARTVTSAVRGSFRTSATTRAEAMGLVHRG
jgi:GTP cyclohydrolase I